MSGGTIDAHESQGLVNNPQASVEQRFGDEQNVNTDGGDAAGRDINKRTIINIFFPGGNSNSISEQSLEYLLEILEPINNYSITKAYRDSLPTDSYVFRPEVTDYRARLAQLQEFGQLLEFVAQLKKDENVPPPVREQLGEIIEKFIQHDGLKQPVPTAPKSSKKLQSYLLVLLCPDPGTDRFFVNAWLIPDDTVQDPSQRFKPLDIDEQRKGGSCLLKQVPKLIDQFLELCLRHLMVIERYELTIEVFLPLDHLCTEVDAWQIFDPIDQKLFSVGTQYKVVVRSYERLDPGYLARRRNLWYDNWDRVKQLLNTTPNHDEFEHLEQIDCCNWKILVKNLTQKLGLKLTCVPSVSKNKDLFKSIHTAAVPIAIWPRYDIPNSDIEINQLLTAGPLMKLTEQVRLKREDADLVGKREEHLGYHLTVLWEDPYRLPPVDGMAQLLPPGQ